MKMPVHNFDEHFAEFTSEWMKTHKEEYRHFDEMEEDMPRIYMSFLNTRAGWLGSITPGSYFTQFEDPKVLVDWMCQYCEEGVPIPDPLLEQIVFVGKPCEKRLTELLKDEEAEEEVLVKKDTQSRFITEGENMSFPDDPKNDDPFAVFKGWFDQKEGGEKYD